MADRNLLDLHPRLQTLCQQWQEACNLVDIKPIITETWRSYEQQDTDYAQGRTIPGHIITNARGGESPHNCTDSSLPDGLPCAQAFDFALLGDDGEHLDWDATDARWQKAIGIGKALGLVSGGDFHSLKDYPHFELPNWKQTT